MLALQWNVKVQMTSSHLDRGGGGGGGDLQFPPVHLEDYRDRVRGSGRWGGGGGGGGFGTSEPPPPSPHQPQILCFSKKQIRMKFYYWILLMSQYHNFISAANVGTAFLVSATTAAQQ